MHGAYLENGELYFCGEHILSASELLTDGLHNIQNALAAIAAAKIMGVPSESIARSLASFKGIRHRIEYVGEADGIKYVDDSKGTNVDATIKAVGCMKGETVLLLGGKDKGYDYDKLFVRLRSSAVVHAVIYGENRFRLLESALRCGFDRMTLCAKFDFAVRLARMIAERGQTVLLSPASASFDEFASYEERGDQFVAIVRSFEEESARNSARAAESKKKTSRKTERKALRMTARPTGQFPGRPSQSRSASLPLRSQTTGKRRGRIRGFTEILPFPCSLCSFPRSVS